MEEPTPKFLTATVFLCVVLSLAVPAIIARDSQFARTLWGLSWMLFFGGTFGAFGNSLGREFHAAVGVLLAIIFGLGGLVLGLLAAAYTGIVILGWPMGIC